MLQFVLGRAGSGKTEYVRRLLANRARAGEGPSMLLVPEQYTFETEKAMLRLAGPVGGNAIPVYSFTRLAEAVFRREGGAVGAGSQREGGASSWPGRWRPARTGWSCTRARPRAAGSTI